MFQEIESNKYYKLMVLLAKELPDKEDKALAGELLLTVELKKLYDCALEHDMESIIFPTLRELCHGKVPEWWEKKYLENKRRIEFMIGKLKEIAKKLDKENIPIVALKNGGIAAALMDDLAKCPMGDIDTLVRKNDFLKAHEIITGMGYRFRFRSEFEKEDLQQAFTDGGTEYYFADEEQEMWFEMSWRPIAGRWIRMDREPDSDQLIEAATYIKDSKIKILSPEDNLLQVAIHTAKHSYVREPGFRLHLDVERIVKNTHIDWELFLKKTEEVGTGTAVYFSLYIAHRLFGTPVHSSVLQELRPASVKEKYISYTLKKAQLLHPVENKFSRIDFVFFQLMLYDDVLDIVKVIFPSAKWIKQKYGFDNALLYPYYLILRLLDLIGIRQKKIDS